MGVGRENGEPENPFVFDRPLADGGALVGRERDLVQVFGAMRAGGEVLVEGPHAHGKTSLVNAALAKLAAEEGGVGVRVGCAGVLTVDDFARRLQEAYAQAWADASVEEVLVERLEALSLRLSTTAGTSGSQDRLQALFDVVGDVSVQADCRAVVCFDDFQDTLAVPAALDAIGQARARENDRLGYVFAGVELAALREKAGVAAWSERAPVATVGIVEPDLFVHAISRRFAETGRDAGEAAPLIAGLGAGHPQRTSLLAWQLWELTGPGERANVASARKTIEQALVRCAAEFDLRWHALHSNERRVAVAIANEIAPQGTRAQRATGLAGFGAAQRALQGIKSSGVAQVRNDRATLTDPLFAEWLRRRYSQNPAEPDWVALRRQAELSRGGMTRRM
jgi:uncharacterized protein